MSVGTAVPDASQLLAVKHYFIRTISVRETYTAGDYERDALELIGKLFEDGHETLVMTGGSMFMKDGYNFQIGARGNGMFIQTGGDISMSAYACVGRYPGGVGEYRLHGGTFTHRVQSDGKNLFFVAEEGTGTVSIANGGRLTSTNANGVCIASKAGSKGTPSRTDMRCCSRAMSALCALNTTRRPRVEGVCPM